ncbi:probable E3 ubiquitin-protein ligase RHA4A [Punica granatum]|uniref:RING-type domain-containing protein n=2 Tax=Punica granatum TaxID=22663 RepID=A0A218WHD4_PUNGR|nr:probable E3 ubiquitin-protein ligase RHA4A [Punica granatum]OWM72237.1 hypothetical protein CDL15_Pgr018122 [Punica granatum]PKI64395.1 hypothetical protein CRG98_015255 [Punica granatum]
MGLTFPSLAMSMAKGLTFVPLKALLRHLVYVFLATLARSGFLRLRQGGGEEEEESLDQSSNMVLVMDGSSPLLVHVRVVTAMIKKRVPVVEYGDLLERNAGGTTGGAEEVRCAVCLSGLLKKDEIRELRNCGHVFHRQCLDSWVDLDHVTCPLCRSLLLPPSSKMGVARTPATSSTVLAACPSRQRGGDTATG